MSSESGSTSGSGADEDDIVIRPLRDTDSIILPPIFFPPQLYSPALTGVCVHGGNRLDYGIFMVKPLNVDTPEIGILCLIRTLVFVPMH